MPSLDADIAVIGAGAAGLMASIAAARAAQKKNSSLKIVLLDSRKKVGAKILISGGTRCNVTHCRVTPEDYEGGPKHFIKHVLEAFNHEDAVEFFKALGVELVLEETGKYFPSTHSGKTVLEALLKELDERQVELKSGVKIERVRKSGDYFELQGNQNVRLKVRSVILCTGGLSYPETGSDGQGYEIAKSFGHRIVETVPALTPLMTHDNAWKSLSGVSLNVRLSFFHEGRKKKECSDSFLFTHFGFSGPAALDISRHVASHPEGSFLIEASFLPIFNDETMKLTFEGFRDRHPAKLIKNFFTADRFLPESLLGVLFKKTGLDPALSMQRCPKKDRQKLLRYLLHCPLEVTGVLGYKKAEVTAGGVDLSEIKASTMESKITPGLFFAGEILDADGRIGGFNFQWAWSGGSIAGKAAVERLL